MSDKKKKPPPRTFTKYPMPNITESTRKRLAPMIESNDDDLIKYLKREIPPEEVLLNRDMFTLPPHIVKRLNPLERKFYDKGRKFLLVRRNKNAQSTSQPQSKMMKNYSQLMRERQEFRKKILDFVLNKGELAGEDEETSEEDLTKKEKQLLKYYYYIKHGIDTQHIAPIDETWVNNILDKIPGKLKKRSEQMGILMSEIKDEYLDSIKKAVVDFTLRDPREPLLDITDSDNMKFSKTIVETTPESKSSLESNRTKILNNLFTIHPVLTELNNFWYRNFSYMRLIDVEELRKSEQALDLANFFKTCVQHIEQVNKLLQTKWYEEIQKIFARAEKRSKKHPKSSIPKQEVSKKKFKHFYETVAALMTFQLQSLCIESLLEYTNFILDLQNEDDIRTPTPETDD